MMGWGGLLWIYWLLGLGSDIMRDWFMGASIAGWF